MSHLKDDIKTFKHEANDDRKLIKVLKKGKKDSEKSESKAHEKAERKRDSKKKRSKSERKIAKVMKEGMEGELHSGSKKGPIVKKRSQMIAIALSEAKRNKKK